MSYEIPLSNRVVARGMREFGKVLSALAGNAHRLGWLPDRGDVRVIENVPYAERAGKQSVDLYLPERPLQDGRPHPFFFFIHGGGWVIGDRKMGAVMGRVFAKRGIALVSAGYRLAPGHGLAEQLWDVQEALSFVHREAAQWNLDPGRFALVGESAGGHLALRLAQEFPAQVPDPRAVVGFYGLYDLESWSKVKSPAQKVAARFFLQTVSQGESYREVARAHHALRPLAWDHVPVLLLHGEADGLVPVAQSRKLAKLLRAQGVDVTLKTYPGVGHGFNYALTGKMDLAVDAYKTVGRFFYRHVVEDSQAPAAGARAG